MHHKVTAALVAALALSVASCGSSKSTSTTSAQTTTTTSKPVNQTPFAARVDAVCQHAEQGISALLKKFKNIAQSDAASRRKAGDVLRAEVVALEALRAPAKLRSDYALYKASVRTRIASLPESPQAKSKKPVLSNAQLQVHAEKQQHAIRRIGLTKCF
jgi:hypothetical protein